MESTSRKLLTVFVLTLALVTIHATARAGIHNETFTTEQFNDTGNTTAEWDTESGTLHLGPTGIGLPRSVSTSGAVRVIPAGGLLYVANNQGIEVYDASWPFPILGSFAWDPLQAPQVKDIALDGNRLVVALERLTAIFPPQYAYNLDLLDVSDPTIPTFVSRTSLSASPKAVCTQGGYAYVAVGTGIHAVDLTGSAIATFVTTPGTAGGVDAQGDFLYVGDGTALRVYDISVPMLPSPRGSVFPTNWTAIAAIQVDGNVAFAAAGSDGYLGFDVSNPDSPFIRLGLPAPTGEVKRLNINGDILSMALGSGGAMLMELPLGTASSRVVFTIPGSDVRDVATIGTDMFVADATTGLNQHDSAISGCATEVSRVPYLSPLSGALTEVIVSGDYVFTNDGCVHVLDISDPWNPIEVSSVGCNSGGFGGPYEAIAVSGNLLCMTSGTEFEVVDISNRSAPVTVGSLTTPGTPIDIGIVGDRAYVSDGAGGFRVMVIASPSNPWQSAVVTNLGSVSSIRGAGDYLYALVDGVGLKILDGVPGSATYLQALGTYPLAQVGAMDVDGRFVYLTEYGASEALHVVNVSDPASPFRWVRSPIDPPLSPFSVVSDGDRLWIGGENAISLYSMELVDPYELCRTTTGNQILQVRAKNLSISGDLIFYSRQGIFISQSLAIDRVYSRDVNAFARVGQSLPFHQGTEPVVAIRITPVGSETERVNFQVSGNQYGTLADFQADGVWHSVTPDTNGSLVRWRAELEVKTGVEAPVLSSVTTEWRRQAGLILGIDDVPDDQGGFVTLRFEASAFDGTGLVPAVTMYELFRQPGAWSGAPANWDSVTSVVPSGDDAYSLLVSTPSDSSLFEGPRPWRYMVRCRTTSRGTFYYSSVDSGYSIDNLAPGTPVDITAAYTWQDVVLEWAQAPEADFRHFRIYRGSDPAFIPGPGNLVQEIEVPFWVDHAENPWSHYYRISAVDSAGNEGDSEGPGKVSGVPGNDLPARTELIGAAPNPFNPSTKLSYELATPGPVRLTVYDAAGRLVSVLVDESQAPGRYAVAWDGRDDSGRLSASGMYFYKLEAGGYGQTRRMMLIK